MSYIDPAGKLLGHIDVIAQVKMGLRPAPINVEIDLSNRCSLGCAWCHMAHTHTKGPLAKGDKLDLRITGGDLMNTELALRIPEELAIAGVKSITWSGGGEPTLHPDFNEIIGNAYDVGIGQGIYTHGGHIDDERAALLKRAMSWVYVSLDAADGETWHKSKSTSLANWDKTLDNIRRLVRAEGDANIGLGFMIHKDNYHRAGGMIALGTMIGVDYVQLRPAVAYKLNKPGEVDGDAEWAKTAAMYLNKYRLNKFVIMDLDRFKEYGDWQGHGYDTCWWSGLQTVITPNGKLWTCCNKREFPGAFLGDMSETPFMDIWSAGEPHQVNGQCRVMCRGHIPNKALERMMKPGEHGNFI